ncbi:olfactory receptor 2B6-like [Pseudophryne corroboree]|uniref:olfactory receptor 2B6-like n=1 Tax=Pseudophryne corroboree TaxID=495146 RepID=UPI0030815F1E
MVTKNQTILNEFILLGFSKDPVVNAALFVLFFNIYIVTIAGNGLMICMVFLNPQLHKPMYFFLCILSILDLCYSTTTVPRLLADLFSTHRIISSGACGIQLYVILLVEGCECLLLALMAYDRYVAICQPLYYSAVMTWSVCYKQVALSLIASFMMCILPSLFMQITLCYNQINHFMCELLAILKLSCNDISSNELVIFSVSFLFSLLLPLVLIIVSYGCIIVSVLKIRTAGRSKAFSTCTSHLVVVALYFGTAMLMYFGPSSQYSTNQEKYSSICYVILSPMLNPLIYSLNNREVKETFQKQVSKCNVFIFSKCLTH